MIITLPRRKDGSAPGRINVAPGTSLVVIGANGAGKTRFTSEMVERLGDCAFRISALDGLYERRRTSANAFGVRSRCDENVINALERSSASSPTGLEILLSQLMHEEMLNLIGYKLAVADGKKTKLRRTKLDKVIEIWQ